MRWICVVLRIHQLEHVLNTSAQHFHNSCVVFRFITSRFETTQVCNCQKWHGCGKVFEVHWLRRFPRTNFREPYLNCIGYEGSREPTLENLEALSFSHKLAVPYSNLHYFGGPITNLDLEVLFDKIVVKGSGGTCYEMNGLFKWLLRQLGYNVTTTQGNWFMPEYQKWTVDYFHMILLVSVKLSKFRHFLRIPWCVSEFLLWSLNHKR